MALLFKICSAREWPGSGLFEGSAVDRRDGFIHLSAAHQVRETAERHFAGQDGLVLIAFDDTSLGSALVWEPSRGGALFPHVYGALDPAMALWVKPLPFEDGAHKFPSGVLP
jgi:uncharacterized protein (DUF952 family)